MKRLLVAVLCLVWASAASAQDAIDLNAAVVHNSPQDVANWARTTKITKLIMQPENSPAPGLSFEFAAHATWPAYTPPGWDGPIQYTVWAGVRIAGVWHVSGIIQMWQDREATGAPLLAHNNFAINWVYDQRWGAMNGYQPVAGEAMIFFLTAGDARGVGTVTSVRERSNVVMVNLPGNDSGVFPFAILSQRDLLIDFGSQGLWQLTDASNYTEINPANPKNVVAGDLDGNGIDEVIVDFGPGIGIWIRWNGSAWSQLHTLSADTMATGDLDNNGFSEVILSFPGAGTWIFWNASRWTKLNDQSAAQMLVANIDGGGQDLVLDFPGQGVWIFRNGTSWLQLHSQSPTAMAAGDFDGNGTADLVFTFPGQGVWVLINLAYWAQVTTLDAAHLAAGDVDGNHISDLVGDFGPGAGIWLLRNGAVWNQVHGLTAQQIVLGDLDGNGQDDIIINFGAAGGGVWILGNLSTWIHAHPDSPDKMVMASLN